MPIRCAFFKEENADVAAEIIEFHFFGACPKPLAFRLRDRSGLVAPWWLSLSMLAELVEAAARREIAEKHPVTTRKAWAGAQKRNRIT
jgi:hypothetical protein